MYQPNKKFQMFEFGRKKILSIHFNHKHIFKKHNDLSNTQEEKVEWWLPEVLGEREMSGFLMGMVSAF